MKKVTTMVLMLCLILSGAFSYAHSVARTENKKAVGVPLEVVADSCVTFRATDYFEITGPFQVENGGELTVIMQECPDEATEVKQANYKNNKP